MNIMSKYCLFYRNVDNKIISRFINDTIVALFQIEKDYYSTSTISVLYENKGL